MLALGLTVTATLGAGTGFAAPLRYDRARVAIGVVVLLVSIPWIAAILGFYLPDGIFIMERPGLEADGTVIAAVHLGQHHGFVGSLIVGSALLLSRPRLRAGRLAIATRLYVSLAFAYGAVNLVQDAWNEQLVKRGTVDWEIPSALQPTIAPVWVVVLGLAVVVALVLRGEAAKDGPNVDSAQ